MTRIVGFGLLAFLCVAEAGLAAHESYPDDPIWVDDDQLDTPVKPAEIELSDLYDRFGHMFHDFGASEIGGEFGVERR